MAQAFGRPVPMLEEQQQSFESAIERVAFKSAIERVTIIFFLLSHLNRLFLGKVVFIDTYLYIF